MHCSVRHKSGSFCHVHWGSERENLCARCIEPVINVQVGRRRLIVSSVSNNGHGLLSIWLLQTVVPRHRYATQSRPGVLRAQLAYMSQPTNRHGAAHIYVTPKYTANDIAGVDHITEYSTVSVSLTPRTVRYEVFRFYADYGYVSKQLFRTTPDSLRLLGPHSHEPHFHAVSDNISLIGVRMHAI